MKNASALHGKEDTTHVKNVNGKRQYARYTKLGEGIVQKRAKDKEKKGQ